MAPCREYANIQIEKIETAPFGTNAYIIVCKETKDSVLIDAPGEAERIATQLTESNPKYFLITHSHMDHIGALNELKTRLNVPICAHPLDAGYLPLSPEILLKDGDEVHFGKLRLKVLHTPGHTSGSVCFMTGRYLISGDTLFPGGPGRTSTPSDFEHIVKSIKEKILVLPDDVQIYPGHGDSTILKKEKEEFAIFSSRPHSPNLCGHVQWLSA